MADPGFSQGGCANSQFEIILQYFCQKLHENERIWTWEGARIPGGPLDLPMKMTEIGQTGMGGRGWGLMSLMAFMDPLMTQMLHHTSLILN